MAEANECFNIGSIVNCKTCFNDDLQGEVLAYDSEINTILLSHAKIGKEKNIINLKQFLPQETETASTSGKSTSCDILFVNLNFASQVTVIKEASASPPSPLPSLNLSKLNNRVKKSIEEKSKLLQAMQSGGTVEGQRLFLTIGKTIDEVSWSGADIVVMNQVLISPPYYLENVTEYKEARESNAKAVAHVRKIVEKFYKDNQFLTMNNGKAPSNSPKCSSPTTSAPNSTSSNAGSTTHQQNATSAASQVKAVSQ